MKKRPLLLFLLSVLLLGSCGKKDEFADFGEEYVPGYDDNRSEIKGTVLDGSILYVNNDIYVYCLNLETGESYPLCSKPNCSHNTKECNAYKPQSGVCSYQDQLIVSSGNTVSYLRTDGSGGEEIGAFVDYDAKEYINGNSIGTPIAHRGYLYVGYSLYSKDEATSRFVRLSVSGGEPEILMEKKQAFNTSKRGTFMFSNFYGIGSKVYFQFYDSNINISEIYCYNTKNGKISQIYKGECHWVGYLADDGNWYWMTNKEVVRWNPETDEEYCLYTFTSDPIKTHQWLCFYKDGFVLPVENNPTSLIFYDWEGNVVTEIGITVPKPDYFFMEGHFDNYLVCTYSQGSDKPYAYAVLDTDRLNDPDLEWMIFDFSEWSES